MVSTSRWPLTRLKKMISPELPLSVFFADQRAASAVVSVVWVSPVAGEVGVDGAQGLGELLAVFAQERGGGAQVEGGDGGVGVDLQKRASSLRL